MQVQRWPALVAGAMLALVEAQAQPSAEAERLLERMSAGQMLKLVSGTAALDDAPEPRVAGAAGSTFAIPELGIPSIVFADGPAGLRISPTRAGSDSTYYATAFPVATALASSWNADLLVDVGRAMGREARAYGVDVILAPAMNIHRNPLTGRNFEYYSEDPHLSGRAAAAVVRGIQSTGVGATLKHFAANNQETNRYLLDALISERALREIYLRGFEIAVRGAEPAAIMSAYNSINGVEASQSHDLLTKVLREDWGYDGFVMTDWFAGNDAVAQMQAGNDLLMPGIEEQAAQLRAALGGRLDTATLERNAGRVLEAVLASPTSRGHEPDNAPDLEAHARVARRAAAEGVVLLKNRGGALPLAAAETRVAAFGNTSYDFISGGSGSGDVNEAYTVSLVDGLKDQGFTIDAGLERAYRDYIAERSAELPEADSIFEPEPRPVEMRLDAGLVARKARAADAAIITIGRVSGEFSDRELEGGFNLTAREHELIAAVSEAFRAAGKPVIAVLNIGNVVETASWREHADAIVVPWQGGQEAGNAVADVLSGAVTPSGRLPMTFPVRYADVPSADHFPGEYIDAEPVEGWTEYSTGRLSEVRYAEGVFVGYRHYATRDVPVAYEFGFGLSYTTFDYGEPELVSVDLDAGPRVAVAVTNAGDMPGRETVQIYASEPASGLAKPARELAGFAKTRVLAPGESETLEIMLDGRALASFDGERSAWVHEAGSYMLHVAASSRDVRGRVGFELDEPESEPTSRALVLERPLVEPPAAR